MCDIIFEKTEGVYAEATVLKKSAMRNLVEFTRKHVSESLFFFDKVKLCRSAASLKTRLHRYFLVNFAKFVRTPFLQTTTSDYSSINSISHEERIGKRNCKL